MFHAALSSSVCDYVAEMSCLFYDRAVTLGIVSQAAFFHPRTTSEQSVVCPLMTQQN